MKLNSKFHCGVKALVDICINDNTCGVLQKDIAQRNNMSLKYLDQIISALKSAGLIYKKNGYRQGYTLTRDAETITVYDVYRAFEPELNVYPCLSCASTCPNMDKCATNNFFKDFNLELKKMLESKTIEEIKSRQLEFDCV